MAAVRVTRIIEYTYASTEVMTRDMEHWSAPMQGTLTPRDGLTIRTAVLPPALLGDGNE